MSGPLPWRERPFVFPAYGNRLIAIYMMVFRLGFIPLWLAAEVAFEVTGPSLLHAMGVALPLACFAVLTDVNYDLWLLQRRQGR